MILVPARAGAVPFGLAVQNAYFPASAAEFPNDNPGLHQGVRWVCRSTRGAARALLRAERPRPGAAPLPSSNPPLPASPAPHESELVPPELRLEGPLELDLGRIVLAHRVEDIPAPPAFIYRAFVSSRAPEPSAALASSSAPPLELLSYRVVDQRVASRRVQRGWRVDVAPCLNIEAGPSEPQAQLSTVEAVVIAEPVLSGAEALAEPVPAAPELATLVLAPVALAEPVRPEPARTEPVRRTRRRGASLASRALSPSSTPGGGELERAISELEAVFAERPAPERPATARSGSALPWGERRRSPRGPSSYTSLSSAVLSALSAGGI